MPSVSERSRNNVRAGLFVSFGLALGFGVIIVLTQAWQAFQPQREYFVEFSVQSGVRNLSPGSDVRIGGMAMGSVQAIKPQTQDDPFDRFLVEISLEPSVKLYDNAVVLLSSPLLGNDAWLDIPTVGDPLQGELMGQGATIKAISTAGMLTTLLGPENATAAQQMIADAGQFTNFLANVPVEYEERVVPILDDTSSFAGKANQLVTRVQEEDWPQWAAHVDTILTNVNSASEEVDSLMMNASGAVDEAHKLIVENRQDIDVTIDNVRDVTARFRDETVDKVHALLDRGQNGIDAFTSTMEDAQVLIEGEVPVIQDAVANARLASQQLKLALIEVRRSPWKLLYRPTPDELEHELLYEAARSFALAAGDLKASSSSLDRVLDRHGERLAADEESFRLMRQRVLDSFDNYEKAQMRLVEVILSDTP